MALLYVWSGAAGAGTGANWANAFTTLAAATTPEVAGDTLYVAHDHSELTATATLNFSGTVSNPTKVVCVDRGGSVPPVAADRRATAVIATSANGSIVTNGFTHYDGIIFITGNSTGVASHSIANTTNQRLRFDNCSFRIGSTGNGRIGVANVSSGCYVEFNNCTMSFSAVGQGIDLGGDLIWRNTPLALIGTAVPTILLVPVTGRGGDVEIIGVDLSAAGSGKTLVGTNANASGSKIRLVDCKIDAAVTKSTVPATHGGNEVDFIRTGATGNYRVFCHRVSGTLQEETTVVRTGGASDGTTAIAWKIDTTANCNYSMSFECPPIAIWNDITGSAVTATVEGIWGGGAVPNDDDIWLDVEYLGDASSPQGSFVNDGKATLLTTAAGQTSSTETWGGSTTKFKLGVSFTAQQKGWIYARVKCAKASSTFYIDPLVTLT
jgi:hypothetical protein